MKKTAKKRPVTNGPKDGVSTPICRDAKEMADHVHAATGITRKRYLTDLVYADVAARQERGEW